MFSRFLGIFYPLSRKDFENYTNIKEYIHNLNIGFLPNNIDSDSWHYYPLIRATKYLSVTFENTMLLQEYKKFVKRVEKMKITDKKGRNIAGIINIDAFIMTVLNQTSKADDK